MQPVSFIDSEHSVSRYISGLRSGDSAAAQKIWEKYFRRLIQLANRRLRLSPREVVDEDDVVQHAFTDFFAQVQQGRFPKLCDRDDLWQVLAMLVERRATDQIRKLNTLRGGAGQVTNESAYQNDLGSSRVHVLAEIPSRVPSPDEAMEFVEVLGSRLASLSSETYRDVALLKLQGYSNGEIAKKLCSSLRTVERTLMRIRSDWQAKK